MGVVNKGTRNNREMAVNDGFLPVNEVRDLVLTSVDPGFLIVVPLL